MTTASVLIDPKRMLRVSLKDGPEIAAVTCAYVPAVASDGRTHVAIQVIWDPANSNPAMPYYCPSERLQRILVDPRRLQRVRPYESH